MHHRENWQQLPTSIAEAVDKTVHNIRPPRPTEELRNELQSAGDLTSVSADHDQVDFDPVDGAFTQVKSRSKRSKATNVCESQSASRSTCVSAADSQSATLSHLQQSVSELNTVLQDQVSGVDRSSDYSAAFRNVLPGHFSSL